MSNQELFFIIHLIHVYLYFSTIFVTSDDKEEEEVKFESSSSG